jgi:hypothetical protein
VNDEYDRTRKEQAVIYFKVTSRTSLEGLGKTTKIPVKTVGLEVDI